MMNPRLYTTSYNKPQGQQFDDTAVLSLLGQGPVSRMEFFVFRKMECWKQINHLLCEWLEML